MLRILYYSRVFFHTNDVKNIKKGDLVINHKLLSVRVFLQAKCHLDPITRKKRRRTFNGGIILLRAIAHDEFDHQRRLAGTCPRTRQANHIPSHSLELGLTTTAEGDKLILSYKLGMNVIRSVWKPRIRTS